MDLRQDYLDKINFIAFTSFNAGQIEEALLKLNYNIEVSVCDEEYVSRHCREKMDKGKTVFLFYGMDSRIVEYGRDVCALMVRKSTIDFYKTDFDKSRFSKAVLLLYNGEEADCEFLSQKWNINVEKFNISCNESARNMFFDNADKNAIFIGPDDFAYELRCRGFTYKTAYLSAESVLHAIDSAKEIAAVKQREEEKNKENELRLEQYKVVFNFTNDAILAIDENGIIIAANDMVYKFLKRDKNQRLEGQHIYNVIKGTKMIKAMEKDGGDIGDIFELPYGTVLTHRIPIEVDRKSVV